MVKATDKAECASGRGAEAEISIRHVRIGDLAPAPYNPRTMPAEEMDALVSSIRAFGLVDPILVRRETREIVGGHQRYEAAKRLGLDRVPVVELDISDEQARALNIALNKIGGSWDVPKLAELLTMLPGDLGALTGFDEAAIKRVLHDAEKTIREMQRGEGDPDAVPEPPDEARTKRGDLWLLGRHRLLCGDGAQRGDVQRLLGGAPIHLVHADPPYNVKVEPRSNNAIAAGRSSFPPQARHHQALDLARHPEKASPTHTKLRAKDRPLENDFLPDAEFQALLHTWFGHMAEALLPGHAFYIWGGYANVANYPPALESAGLYFSQSLIWNKLHPVLTRKDFMGAHEWAFYGWKKGAAHRFFGPHNIPDLWEVKKVNPQQMVHLTEKPVELAERAITYSSLPEENVLDLFGGSGSTLIAAERTSRTAFLMEIDPLYCDVIVQRFEQFTGQTAALEAKGD